MAFLKSCLNIPSEALRESDILNTPEGLSQLARIVKAARGHKSLRRFAKEAGLSQSTIQRIEEGVVGSPLDATFRGLARAMHRSPEELRAIAQGIPQSSVKTVQIAEDLIPLVNQLSATEKARLAQYVVASLAQTDVVMDDFSGSGIEQLSNREIGALLKLIGDRLSNQ